MERTTDIPAPPAKGKKFALIVGILGIVLYSVWMVISFILLFYTFVLSLFADILSSIAGSGINIDLDLLQKLPVVFIAVFYLLSLLGLIFLLTRRWIGFWIFVIAQFIGTALAAYLVFVFVGFWFYGTPTIMMFTFFSAMFASHVKFYRR
jgi:hypothetical protein